MSTKIVDMGMKVVPLVVVLVLAACGSGEAPETVLVGSGVASVSTGETSAANAPEARPTDADAGPRSEQTDGGPSGSRPVEAGSGNEVEADAGLSIKDYVVAVDGTETTVSFVPVTEGADIGSVDVRLVTLENILFLEVDFGRVRFPSEAVFKELWLGDKLMSRTSVGSGVVGARMATIGGLAPPVRVLLTNEDFDTLAGTPDVVFDPEDVVGAEELH